MSHSFNIFKASKLPRNRELWALQRSFSRWTLLVSVMSHSPPLPLQHGKGFLLLPRICPALKTGSPPSMPLQRRRRFLPTRLPSLTLAIPNPPRRTVRHRHRMGRTCISPPATEQSPATQTSHPTVASGHLLLLSFLFFFALCHRRPLPWWPLETVRINAITLKFLWQIPSHSLGCLWQNRILVRWRRRLGPAGVPAEVKGSRGVKEMCVLQQLFYLHNGRLDQAVIDPLLGRRGHCYVRLSRLQFQDKWCISVGYILCIVGNFTI